MVVVNVDLVEEMETRTLGTMIEAGGLEAVALGIEGDGVGAREEGGIEVLAGKVALKEGLRSNSGTGTGKRQTMGVVIRMMVEAMTLYKMKMNSILLSSTREHDGCCCLPERDITGLSLSFSWFDLGAIVESFPLYQTAHFLKEVAHCPFPLCRWRTGSLSRVIECEFSSFVNLVSVALEKNK